MLVKWHRHLTCRRTSCRWVHPLYILCDLTTFPAWRSPLCSLVGIMWPVGVVVELCHVTNPPALRGSSERIGCILHLEFREMCKSWMVQVLHYCYCWSIFSALHSVLYPVICGQFLNCLCLIITCDIHTPQCPTTYWPAGKPVYIIQIYSLQLELHDTLGHTHRSTCTYCN